MSSLSVEYCTVARDAYLNATQSRLLVLDQLNDVRRDPHVMVQAEVTEDQVRAAFETVWRVAAFYEQQLWREANEERERNEEILAPLRARLAGEPDPVPAAQVVGEPV